MSSSGSAPGFWQSVKDLPGRTSLRVKLITAVLALVTIALTGSGIAGISALKSYLLKQADTQLQTLYTPGQNSPPDFRFGGSASSGSNGTEPQFWVLEALKPGGGLVRVQHGSNLPTSSPGPEIAPGSSWLTSHTGEFVTVGAQSGSARWRVVAYPKEVFVTNPATGAHFVGTLIVGLDVSDDYATIGQLTSIDLIVSGLVILLLAILGIAVVRASLRPLTAIEQTAEGIAAGDLTRRVPDQDPRTEVGRLGRSLNAMLTQIEAAFYARTASEEAARRSEEAAQWSAGAARRSAEDARKSEERMRQFVADASHELRTPLTAIRGFAEYYRQRGGVADAAECTPANGTVPDTAPANGTTANAATADSAADQATGQLSHAALDRIIRRVEQEGARMGVLIDDMLLLARLDQQRPMEFRTVDLLAIAADALHDARVIAPERDIALTVSTSDAPLVLGDEVRLRQVVGNLMSNAMTHTPDGTPIEITIRSGTLVAGPGQTPAADAGPAAGPGLDPAQTGATEPAVILEVADQGPGLSDKQLEHVFERFYRADRARTAGGTGLGLAIVAALVTAHRGRVWGESQPGRGATFGFALPLAPEARLVEPGRGESDYATAAEAPSADA